MSTTGKLGVAIAAIASVTIYMAILGSRSSWQYYLSVEECVGNASELVDQPIRVSGKIVAGSLQVDPARQHASFRLGDHELQLDVDCQGPLPDNLSEEIEVVVEGRLAASGKLSGDRVLTRCASKYESGGYESGEIEAAPSSPARLARAASVEDRRR